MQATKEIKEIRKAVAKYLHPIKLNATIQDLSNDFHKTVLIDFDTRMAKNADRNFDGLQIIFEDGNFELSEYQAGLKENELHIFGNYKTINAAIKRLLKGKCKPIQIWN